MSYWYVMTLGALLIAINITCALSAVVPDKGEPLKSVSDTLNQFAIDFYKTTADENKGNLICSPISVSMVLSMAAFGAGGDTATSMRSALHMLDNDQVTKTGFESIIDTFNNIKKVKLRVANKIFTASGFEVKPAFKEVTSKFFKSDAQSLDFGNPQSAASTINAWGSAQTDGLIREVIKPDDLAQAAMVLINAVYFKGQWNKKFEESLTLPKPFYTGEATTQDVPMMYQKDSFNYGSLPDLDAIFVELPYEHDNEKDATSMFIILPNKVNGLEQAESNLNKINFKQLHDNRRMTSMHLYLPKFRAESFLNLKPTLIKMGMERMFSDTADFTGIADSPPLKISKVMQKALIEVNEEGSKAAAVTVGVIAVRSGHVLLPPPIIVTIDKPFIYVIVHGDTNSVLFQGHIIKPVY